MKYDEPDAVNNYATMSFTMPSAGEYSALTPKPRAYGIEFAAIIILLTLILFAVTHTGGITVYVDPNGKAIQTKQLP